MTVEQELAALSRRVDELEAEAEIRRIQSRYMFLCDTPCPEFGVSGESDRIDRIMDLYLEDAVWEGVGEYYEGQFGRAEGKAEIRRHFERFWGSEKEPELVLNAHYLTSEQIRVDGTEATGEWIHMQPWVFSDGTSLLRSSRLHNSFSQVPDLGWRIGRTRTENVFVAPLPRGWAADLPSRSVLTRP